MDYKQIITPTDVKDNMLSLLENGRTKGTTTYIDVIDPAWTWRNGEVNIISGMNNEGKSLILKQLCLIKALEEKRKFVFYSPEDYPAEEFYDDMIHTLSGRSTDITNHNYINRDSYEYCFNLIKDHFKFLYIKNPHNTIENIVKITLEEHNLSEVYGLIIDPFVKVSRGKKADMRDDLFAADFLNIIGDFSRTNNINTFLVMHQQTPKTNEQGYYPKPNKYAIKNGGTFADTADNVLFMWRPYYAKDRLDPKCIFGSDKIKKQKLVGIPQDVELSFDRKTNRYCLPNSTTPVYNWNKWLPGYIPEQLF